MSFALKDGWAPILRDSVGSSDTWRDIRVLLLLVCMERKPAEETLKRMTKGYNALEVFQAQGKASD